MPEKYKMEANVVEIQIEVHRDAGIVGKRAAAEPVIGECIATGQFEVGGEEPPEAAVDGKVAIVNGLVANARAPEGQFKRPRILGNVVGSGLVARQGKSGHQQYCR